MQRACNLRLPAANWTLVRMIADEARLRDLMIRSQGGDGAAYRSLLTMVRGHLTSYFARRVGGDAERAEDLVQTTLMAIHAKRDSYDGAHPFSAWAYAIARYKLIDFYRRNKIRRTEPLDGVEDFASHDPGFDAATARADLERLMAGLPDMQARCIELTKVQGLSVAEAADRLGATQSAVKVNVHRGLKTLQGRMAKQAKAAE